MSQDGNQLQCQVAMLDLSSTRFGHQYLEVMDSSTQLFGRWILYESLARADVESLIPTLLRFSLRLVAPVILPT